MSKLLAMIMKPKNYMYATIKGSLTENPSGVFSGFSNSNYLESLNTLLQNATNFEIGFKYNTGSLSRFNYLISGQNNNTSRCFIFGLSLESQLIYFYTNYNGSWGVQVDTSISGITIQANTDYWIKLIYKNGVYSIYISTDGKNYIAGSSANGNAMSDCIGLWIGRANWTTGNGSQGSYDINNFYIKINNTKYKFQFTMPLTVVGSPTIVDGVVSNFSATDFLQTNLVYSDLQNKNIEIMLHYIPSSLVATNRFFRFGTNANTAFYLRIESDLTFAFYSSTTKYKTNLIANNYGYVKFVADNFEDVKIYCSNDEQNWVEGTITTESNSLTIDTTNNFNFGRTINGSINFNNSYMIIDGTKYILTLP